MKVKVTQSRLTLCDPHELYTPWNSLGQNTGVSSLSLLQGIFPTQGLDPGLTHCSQILYHLSHREPFYFQTCLTAWRKELSSKVTLEWPGTPASFNTYKEGHCSAHCGLCLTFAPSKGTWSQRVEVGLVAGFML